MELETMKIGILGTRGIPNHYGGFEQFAQYLSKGLVERGCEVFVYNSHNHPYKKTEWEGVHIIHKYDPEVHIGLSGQFIYDFNCIQDSRKRNFDILLQLGYTTNSIWSFMLPRKPVKICNPDGMEWKRAKYPGPVKKFLKYAEKLAVKSNELLIADSRVIKDYYIEKYGKDTIFAAYPAILFNNPDSTALKKYDLEPYKYHILIARMQADNNIETILSGYEKSAQKDPLLVVGNYGNKYGEYLFKKYNGNNIRFMNAIYDQEMLNQLRHFSHLYFHGHSAGGTNPSLLEAMASSALICAHDNPFNKSVLEDDALFFKNDNDICKILDKLPDKKIFNRQIQNNRDKIVNEYHPDKIIDIYFEAFKEHAQKLNFK